MTDTEKAMIAKVIASYIESYAAIEYLLTDGEDDPDVTLWPVLLRKKGGETFSSKSSLDLGDALLSLKLGLDDVSIECEADRVSITIFEGNQEACWIEIHLVPPEWAEPSGEIDDQGVITYDTYDDSKERIVS